jgi:peptide/nickel transport system ATP-binding protein
MIAMALSNEPRLLIADEPTTALDVTVQAQILELLDRLRRELQMALVIITHDLGVVAETAEQVAVMYAGRIVEQAPVSELFSQPMHPYTWGLLRSIPKLTGPRDEALLPIPGRPPSLISRPKGCAFAERCAYAQDECRVTDPVLATTELSHQSACLIPHERRMAAWPALAAGGTEADALKVVRGTK